MAKNEAKTKEFSEEELRYYSRQIVLQEIGYAGQLKLKNAKVCIVGLGGLGSPSALQLTGIGAGYLRLVDCDVVELPNLHRQILYSSDLVGYPKVEVAAKRLRKLNPYIKIDPLPLSLGTNNAEKIINGMDVVVDGLDRMTPRYALNRACQRLGVPYIFGAAIMTFGNVTTIIPGQTPCLECFQGNLDDSALPTCATVGVHPSVLSVVASIQVSEAIRIVVGTRPRLASKLLHIDMDDMAFEDIEISRAETCPVCGSKPSGSPMPLKEKLVTETCSRDGKRTFIVTPKGNPHLNMDDLLTILRKKRIAINVKSGFMIRFLKSSDEIVSLLKSGVMIIEGARNEKEAYEYYSRLVIEELKVPMCEIE